MESIELLSLRTRARGVYYGWWIVAVGFFNQMLASALLQRSYGAYVVLLRDDFGWSKAALAGAYSIQQLESGILGPLQGWLIDRFGPRVSMFAGSLLFGFGFILFSRIHSLQHFYMAYLLIAIGSSLCGFFPLSVVIVNWFEKRRAKALSTMQMGGAIGGFFAPVIAFSLETFGWRDTAFFSGLLVMAIGIPLSFFVRRRPEDHGLAVDGATATVAAADASGSEHSASRDFTAREALRTPAFWLISLGHGSALLIVSAVNVHIVAHLKDDFGYSLGAASLVVSAITVAQLGGMAIAGSIGDLYDKRLISMACMASHAIALLLVAFAVNWVMVAGFALLHGVAWGLRGPMMQAIRADYFGRTSFGTIMGFSSLVVMLGTLTGPLVAGYLADRTGSYQLGFTILAILSGMGSLFFLLTRRPTLARLDPAVPVAAGVRAGTKASHLRNCGALNCFTPQ